MICKTSAMMSADMLRMSKSNGATYCISQVRAAHDIPRDICSTHDIVSQAMPITEFKFFEHTRSQNCHELKVRRREKIEKKRKNNHVTPASLSYPLSVFNKNSTLNTANPTYGDIFESSKLKAQTSLLPCFSEKRRSSFEL